MVENNLQSTFIATLVLVTFSCAFSSHLTDTTADQTPSQNDLLPVHSFDGDELVYRQRRVFPLQPQGEADKTGFYSLSESSYELYGILFGHLLLENELKRKGTSYRCEGVLIGPKHVLTVYPECYPPAAGSAYAKKYHDPVDPATEKIVFQYTKNKAGKFEKVTVNVESMWRTAGSKYLIALLADDPTLMGLSREQFPLLTWAKQDNVNNYNLYLEKAKDYPVLLSTPTATQDLKNYKFNNELRHFLEKSEFEKNPTMITLRRGRVTNPGGFLDATVKVGGSAIPLSGAAFFKPVEETVALLGFMSEAFTEQCYDDSFTARNAGVVRKRKQTPQRAETFHCGHRMNWEDVQNLYQIGLAVDDRMPRDNTIVFPQTPTVIGSWNLQHVRRFDEKRGLSTKVYETLMKVIEKTHILALQEAEHFDDRYKGIVAADVPLSSLKLLQRQANIGYRAHGEFVFVFDTTKVSVVAGTGQPCGQLDVQQRSKRHNYAYWCKFKFTGMTECFTLYSAHFMFSDGDPTDRAKEFKHFSDHARIVEGNGAADCGRVQILAGDFNLQSSDEVDAVASNFLHFRFQDAGPTTPSETETAHYDHVLVSETLRMPHYYIFPGLKTAGGPVKSIDLEKPYGGEFVPRDNPGAAQLRAYEPKVRSLKLSDHLPVQTDWNGLRIGTWNMRSHRPGLKPALDPFYSKVMGLFSVVAVQELSVAPPANLYGRNWMHSSLTFKEHLGFAYDSAAVEVTGCVEIDLSTFGERTGYACEFKKKPGRPVVTIVSLHLLNKNSPTTKYVRQLLTHIRGLKTDVQIPGNPASKHMPNWKQSYVMGDFNSDDLKKLWTGAHAGLQCTHKKSLPVAVDPGAPWTFTRVPSRLTLDYIFAAGSDVPGDANCKVIHPELEKVGPTYLIDDDLSKTPYGFFGSWVEVSDHYPVFMEFAAPTEPAGTAANKRAALGVNQEWP